MYSSLYVHDGATAQALTSTPAKLTGFATLGPDASARDGDQSAVGALSSDQIAVKAGGIYRIAFHLSAAFSAAALVQIHARFGTTEIAQIAAQNDVVASVNVDKYIGYSAEGIYIPATDGNISLYGETSSNGNLTPAHGALIVQRIG